MFQRETSWVVHYTELNSTHNYFFCEVYQKSLDSSLKYGIIALIQRSL